MLNDREIVRLHQMKKDGKGTSEIASILDCHPQTVYEHLNFRIRYSKEIYQKIEGSPKFPTDEVLSIYEAAIFLPGWPSKDKTYRLFSSGILKSIEPPRKHVSIMTSRKLVAAAAKKMLPEQGLFISTKTLRCMSQRITYLLRKEGRPLVFWPSKERFIRMSIVTAVAAEIGEPIQITASTVYRCNKTLELCGVATL